MCQLIETIKIKDKTICNIEYHTKRFNKTRKKLFNISSEIDLNDIIKIPANLTSETYKCRVTYSTDIELIEFEKYEKKEIKSLKVINYNNIDYSYKYKDRTLLNKLFEKRNDCDDIIIVKNNLVTDSSYANIVFFDGQNWYTPTKPLLPGTKRALLLSTGKIEEREIMKSDIYNYEKISLINAMLDLSECIIDVKNIKM